jgi:peptidoglycan/xylan/chitin deacetylase (PgdA/CDA1 family)
MKCIMSRAILRYDDFSALTNADLERRLLEIVAKRDARIVVSIVPFAPEVDWPLRGPIHLRALPHEKAALLKEFMPGVVEIALHGYCHQSISRASQMVEFGNRIPLDFQVARLRDAKHYLEDLFGEELQVFVPPFNAYGASLISALRETGFQALSGDAAFGPIRPCLAYIPATVSLHHVEASLRTASHDGESLVCLLIHEHDFEECGSLAASANLSEFSRLLDALTEGGARWIGFKDCLLEGDWGPERARANQKLRETMKSPFRHLLRRGTGCVYWSQEEARRRLRTLRFFDFSIWKSH